MKVKWSLLMNKLNANLLKQNKMNQFDELLEKLNQLQITQKSGDWAEDIPEDIWKQYFQGNFEQVKHGLAIDTHRWYETSISVIKIYGRFLGIRYITNMFSEQQDYEDCFVHLKFTEMKEVPTVTYETIKLQIVAD